MNILEEIQNCPVEWKELGEVVFTLTSPVKLAKKQYQLTGRIPIVDQGEQFIAGYTRSEERRVGKECDTGCRSRWSPYH